jgi:hypothetical protein
MAGRGNGIALSRRAALWGLGAAAGAAWTGAATAAQPDDGKQTPGDKKKGGGAVRRLMPFEATIRQGPRAGTELRGVLDVTIGPSGAIDRGTFALDDGRAIPVAGQVTGRAVSLLMELGAGGTIYGVGTSLADLRHGVSRVGGPFAGPLPGEAGDWVGGANSGTAQDAQGRLYISNPNEHVIYIKTSFGAPSEVFAGAVGVAGYVDAGRRNARFNRPGAIAIDPAGTALYVADYNNQAVRRITLATNQVSTVVGLPQARAVAGVAFWGVDGVDADPFGAVSIGDSANHVVWRYNQNNLRLRVLAGAIGQPGLRDGVGSGARFNTPTSVEYEGDGATLAVADNGNFVVRLVSPGGDVVTLGPLVPGSV